MKKKRVISQSFNRGRMSFEDFQEFYYAICADEPDVKISFSVTSTAEGMLYVEMEEE